MSIPSPCPVLETHASITSSGSSITPNNDGETRGSSSENSISIDIGGGTGNNHHVRTFSWQRFITHRAKRHQDEEGEGWLIAHGRRHRKGLKPHRVCSLEDEEEVRHARSTALAAFCRCAAPVTRLSWWISINFMVGSALFTIPAVWSASPSLLPSIFLGQLEWLNFVFFVGSIFFTIAAYLQFLESINADVKDAFSSGKETEGGGGPQTGDRRQERGEMKRSLKMEWQWWAWLPHNLGYCAAVTQLVGTLLFNMNTFFSTRIELSLVLQDILVWVPNMIGSIL